MIDTCGTLNIISISKNRVKKTAKLEEYGSEKRIDISLNKKELLLFSGSFPRRIVLVNLDTFSKKIVLLENTNVGYQPIGDCCFTKDPSTIIYAIRDGNEKTVVYDYAANEKVHEYKVDWGITNGQPVMHSKKRNAFVYWRCVHCGRSKYSDDDPSDTNAIIDYYNLENENLNFTAELDIVDNLFNLKVIDVNTDGSQIFFTFSAFSYIHLLGILDVKERSITLKNFMQCWVEYGEEFYASKFPNSNKFLIPMHDTVYVANLE